MIKQVFVAGCTGSIGVQALEVIDKLEGYEVSAILGGKNKKLLTEQASQYKIDKAFLSADNIDLSALVAEADYVINAISGFAGLELSIEALKQGKKLCLANKESVVTAGHIMLDLMAEHGGFILPIDSEHSAIWQALQAGKEIKKVWITASGGSFRDLTKKELENVTVKDALKHPNWNMGAKITIDSATLFNKALEIIEAKWLFSLTKEEIIPVVHRQSIVHSMVQFVDNVFIAKMSKPSMKTPIQYSLTFPDRVEACDEELSIKDLASLTFEDVDYDKYDSIKLVFEYFDKEESYMVAFNAANEVAVELFSNEKIKFLDIFKIVRETLESHKAISEPTLEQIYKIDKETRKEVESKWAT